VGRIEPLPEPRFSEAAVTVGRAALGSIPVVGPAAAELFGATVAPVVYRRQVEWLNGLADAVNALGNADERWTIETLAASDEFASAVMSAAESARRTASEEKHSALRNAVLNSVAPGAPDAHEQMVFLRFVDELTPMHLRLLAYGDNPREWFRQRGIAEPNFTMGGPSHLLEAGIPEMTGRRDLYDQLVRDLDARGLASVALHTTMTADGAWQSWTSAFGKRFLEFISEPVL